ncbi:syntaxin-16 [Anthonomus grandis grandis]|uniref:syntaxin-16 n=1 Tax=Anthonomus grandis grandis TaxID=2921223 RepID=UPI002165BBA5|nr:syntaxin-16 [Anthonomus grandis grandis]
MAHRSLTDVFLLMRNNAIRSRQIYPDQDSSERMHLVSLTDIEEGYSGRHDNKMPPVWIDYLEKAQMILPRLKAKIGELKSLHSRHLNRSTFDDSPDDEIAIDNCTQEITRMFNEIHRLLQIIKSHSLENDVKEQRLTVNVYMSLANALQDLSSSFRATQNSYLRQIQGREDRSKMYFEQTDPDLLNNDTEDIDSFFVNTQRMSQQQLLMLEEENTRFAQEREKEVNAIVKSIVDLNEIFKDLSQMVADQGTVLDRIDYNIENTQIQVYEGYKQLQKADTYQRKNRKMCVIVTLAALTILLTFILIIVKL